MSTPLSLVGLIHITTALPAMNCEMLPLTTCLITGATGFLGGHLAEACAQRGWQVRALARPGSESSALTHPHIRVVAGDLTDPASLPAALDGVEVVFHAAAKVGDWGPAASYRAVNVEGTRALLEACRQRSCTQPLQRFIHFSSLGVYAARDHFGTNEDEPLPERHIDGYTQTKVEAEKLVLAYHREHGLPVTVLRPGFIYGPRDRTVLPKLIENLRKGIVKYLGDGNQALNTIYVGNLVAAAFLPLDRPESIGRVYNLTDGERVSKRRFIESIADGLGLPRPTGSVPMWVARLAAWSLETVSRALGSSEPPRLTQARLKFLGLNLDFSIERARRELGYQPPFTFEQGLAATLHWYKAAAPSLVAAK
ncbi:MAG: NAD-dependent epimerase/dehydratase family protein [Gemmataceae bacterium]